MTPPRILSVEATRDLLDGTTPGPWGVWEGYLEVHARVVEQSRGTIRAEGGEVCKIDEYRSNPTDRNPRSECDCEEADCPECFPGPRRDIALIAAAPDLAATVVHLYGELATEQGEASYQKERAERAEAEAAKLRADLERAGELIARNIENRAVPLAWGSVEWKRETPDVLTLRLADGVGERVARIPVEKGALVGAAAKVASDTMRDEARAAKADAKRAKAGKK